MREITFEQIKNAVSELCIRANLELPADLEDCIKCSAKNEKSPVGREVFSDLCENILIAKNEKIAICQDTGMAVVFAEIGQEVHITGGAFEKAVSDGVADGYIKGFLRCSIVSDPIERVNTGDNTPPVIHTRIVDGGKIRLTVAPKGFGSENMSALKMMTPSATVEEIISYVVGVAEKAGSNPCPPIVVGVGIGGDFEHCAYLAKKALCRSVSVRNPKKLYSDMESSILDGINRLGIGPQGFGGTVTALCVNIEEYPTHIAGLPVAVNIGCHVTRHASTVL
ncbi:MAG: fumarate hydratase [Oscillospiraceae bacterium]|jgi:fumarate hydratase subunit alpha